MAPIAAYRWAELEHVETLHASPSSEVFTARRQAGGPELLVVKRAKITDPSALTRFHAEAALLRECARAAAAAGAPVVALLGVIAEAPRYALVLPHHRHGSLYHLLHAPDALEIPPTACASLLRDVLSGLAAVHACGVVHRDIKPHNVLLGEDGSAVLADFGVAVRQAELDAIAGGALPRPAAPSGGFFKMLVVGTLPYMAPELLRGALASQASDAYAVGILANELLTLEIPYASVRTSAEQMHTVIESRLNCDALARAVAGDELRPGMAEGARAPAPALTVLVMRLWSPSPALRPSMATALDALRQADADADAAAAATAPAAAAEGRASVRAALAARDAARRAAKSVPAPCATDALATRVTAAPAAPLPAVGGGLDGGGRDPQACALRVEGAVEASPGKRGADRMEDRCVLRLHRDPSERPSLALVADGHGGEACAQHLIVAIPDALAARLAAGGQGVGEALRGALSDAHASWLASPAADDSGAAVLGCVLDASAAAAAAEGAPPTLHLAAAGDCVAVLVRGGKALVLSPAHVADDPAEAAAARARGATVSLGADGRARLGGSIQLTRALGDRRLQAKGLSAQAEVRSVALERGDEMLIVGSDGLFERLSPAEAVRCARATVRSADLIARRLCAEALARGTGDNITAAVLTFTWL
jgi:serine/threonine protein phosphatase PrpC